MPFQLTKISPDAPTAISAEWIFPELLEEGLEPWGKVRMVFIVHPPNATHAVDVTDYIDKGIASLKEHKVYLDNLAGGFDPETFLQWGAAEIGQQAGCEYAVAFEVIKL